MKRYVIGAGVSASVVLLILTAIVTLRTFHVLASIAGTLSPSTILTALSGGKSIDVAIYTDAHRVDRRVPALAGSSVGFSRGYGYSVPGRSVQVQVEENYQVVADSPGHFQITLHRAVQTDGTKTIFDFTLPVWKNEPGPDKRIKLLDGSTAVAYLATDSH